MSLRYKAAVLVPALAAVIAALPVVSVAEEVVVESGYSVAPSGVRSRSGMSTWTRTRGGQQSTPAPTPAAPVAPVVQGPPPCTVSKVYFEWVNVPTVTQVQSAGTSGNSTAGVRSRSGARGSAPTVTEVITYTPTLVERTRQVPCPEAKTPGNLGLVAEAPTGFGGSGLNVEPQGNLPSGAVPLPSVIALLGIGAVGLFAAKRRRQV